MSVPTILRVALDTPLRRPFDYLPATAPGAPVPGVGSRVRVPFGRRRLVGVIVGAADTSVLPTARLKAILDVLDARPLLDEASLGLLEWAAEYYHHPIGQVLASALPRSLRLGAPAAASLPRWQLTAAGEAALAANEPRRAPRQRSLLELLRARGPATAADLDSYGGDWRATARALRERGWISSEQVPVASLPPPPASAIVRTAGPELHSEQAAAVEALAASLGQFAAFVLHGITGSGKTEVSVILLGLFALYLLVNYRTRKLQNERVRLEQAVAERSEALAQANKELEEMSLTDPLTAARNRRFFQATIATDVSQAIRAYSAPDPTRSRRNRDIVFYLIDADHFKEINDRFGHDAGDQMLIDLTGRISSAIRYSDVLVRWGGEEFLVVSRFCERKEAATLAARVLSAVSCEPFKIKGAGVSLHRTVSIGWAAFPWNMDSPIDVNYEEVLALADRALYKAKAAGRNLAIGALPPESAAEPHTTVPHGDSEARVSEIASTADYVTTYGLETTSIT